MNEVVLSQLSPDGADAVIQETWVVIEPPDIPPSGA